MFMICQLPSCNVHPTCLFSLERHHWENYGPRSYFPHQYNLRLALFVIVSLLFHFYFNCFSLLYTFNSLVFSNTGRLTTFSESWGQESVCVLCAGPCSLTRQTASNLSQVFEVLLVDKPWFLDWGKLLLGYIIPSTWGLPTSV